MRDKLLRKDLKKNTWNSFFYGDSRERVIALCTRLGIEFTDDPDQENEMWAQIGDYLALEQEEFNRPKMGKGRPKKTDDRDVELAEQVEREKKSLGLREKLSQTRALSICCERRKCCRNTPRTAGQNLNYPEASVSSMISGITELATINIQISTCFVPVATKVAGKSGIKKQFYYKYLCV